ncbi:MAG TPA: hydrogenase 2 operon protein HybA [Thermoanaerobaculia bacterium]|nr:hydrogenase 2 operon protein HybA [Thermoanaerobaculia bacterium]
METDRRSLLKGIAAAATMTVVSTPALARERKKAPDDAVGLLYDATKCVGCKACVVKCKEAGDLPADIDGYGGGLYDAPEGLNESTRNVIQLVKDGDETAYVKKQCMHCIDPACVGACMMGALGKREFGIVSWDNNKCIGCRYCQVACPFGVPKFQWSKTSPRIVKCELCRDLLAEGKLPACVDACPRGAVIFGKREELLQIAHQRIDENKDLYVPKVYGETELGGTQVLYLSHLEFEKLGFRFSDDASVPETQQTVQHGIYKGFVAPLALYGLLGAVMFRNRKRDDQ